MESLPRNVVLLGATGSIGENTLAVIAAHPGLFRLLGAAAHSNAEALRGIAHRFEVPHTRLFRESGMEGLVELAALPEADVIVVATTGIDGLRPMLAALEAGKVVGLASKEILVVGGEVVMAAVKACPGRLLPVDSEHNALFQCLDGREAAPSVRRLLLTASGGPFLHHTRREMEAVTLEEALRHPNWAMGPKITIDSATMANKGLEMIEARWLFDVPPEAIDVVLHPQSLIHSLVEFIDGCLLAQLSPPSMTFALQHVLGYPERMEPTSEPLDLMKIHHLELRPPDWGKFPCLRLAREALRGGGALPALFNAANSVAVEAFLAKRIPFSGIARIIEETLARNVPALPGLDELTLFEESLRKTAAEQLQNHLT
ncbi:MAG: 1-deoxy-D-xylulose-5-phosphate reductoisomerase [Verrucomicrobia bacterium]|jgi:1-deoxy-D-xylulose-5-phosphate reductoisomerase|nr:1-deoxy-D-xylulose-5-phosphate reductoisomerase [Verrucomicrobiota bacterium]